jgi:DNA (cytosine-5)-methyltransferase 1
MRTSLSKVADYPVHLEACWQEHLAPRAEDAPTVVSTFAGCGGSSLGYSMAGFRELLAVEWDDNAVATFKLNFPDVPVYHGDIAKLTVEQCLEMAGLQPGQLDVLDGSPPCQGFSTAGKRDFGDDRNQLFREFVRLLRGLQPRVFVMENVSGMVKGKMKLIFADILRELKASGYKVSARLLNAMYFGVPQSRQRMIFVGVREDLAIEPSHPKAETRPLCALCVTEGVDDTINPYGPRNFNQARRHLRHHEPAPTLTKSEVPGSDLPFAGQHRIGDKRAAMIASFPRRFSFTGDWKDAVNRIGNSVPPLFMRSIARHIRREIMDVNYGRQQ